MSSNNENEIKKIECDIELPEEKNSDRSNKEESVVTDLLFVLGFNRKSIDGWKAPDKQIKKSDSTSADFSDSLAEDTYVVQGGFEDLNGDLPVFNTEELIDNSTFNNPETTRLEETEFANKNHKVKKMVLTVIAILISIVGCIKLLPYMLEPNPPSKDVVASYNGKYITVDEFKKYIDLEQLKESDHASCTVHGYDHTQCDSTEECESHPIDSIEGYRQMAHNLAMEQIIQEWAASNGVTQRREVQHGIKDLLENANVGQLIEKLHEEKISPESITNWDIQQYYNDNKESFGSKSLTEVEGEIRDTLAAKKESDFFPQYIAELKQTAGLQINLELLKVTEPTDEEISTYYNQTRSKYQDSESVDALVINFISSDAQPKAAEAIRNIRSGESFESVAKAFGQGGKANEITIKKGSGEPAMEKAIWKLQPGDVSEPIVNNNGSVSIVKLISISKAGVKPLSEVSEEIGMILLQKNMEAEYELRKNEALFSVHSRQYTLGDFYTEFKELSPMYQAQFSTYEQKQQLVEQLITKELLLEETGDDSSDLKQKHSFDELKIQYLSQILHQQKVDDKLEAPKKAEVKKFYEKNKKNFIIPASVQISLIWSDQGANGEKAEQAKKKMSEALTLIKKGTDFLEVAKKYSEDSSASSGGNIDGSYYQYQLPGDLGTKAFALKVGETSDIIDYNYGYYIIKVRDRTEQRQMTFKESAEEIKEYLNEEKHSKLESEMEQAILDDADFIVYDKTLKRIIKEQSEQKIIPKAVES